MARVAAIAGIWCLAQLVLTFSFASGAASGGPVALSALAPVDEYFGRQKLSPFGVRHKVFALKDDLHHARSHPDAIEHDALLTEDALHDWTTRFPHDPWLPATAWNLATLYEELPGADAQMHAIDCLAVRTRSFCGYAVCRLRSARSRAGRRRSSVAALGRIARAARRNLTHRHAVACGFRSPLAGVPSFAVRCANAGRSGIVGCRDQSSARRGIGANVGKALLDALEKRYGWRIRPSRVGIRRAVRTIAG